MKKFHTIDAGSLKSALCSDHPPVLVNALARDAFEEERIPGSISIPAGSALHMAEEVLAKDGAVVVYCSSHSCTASPTLAQKLVDLGFTDVTDFAGGIDEWKRAGLALEGSHAMATA